MKLHTKIIIKTDFNEKLCEEKLLATQIKLHIIVDN